MTVEPTPSTHQISRPFSSFPTLNHRSSRHSSPFATLNHWSLRPSSPFATLNHRSSRPSCCNLFELHALCLNSLLSPLFAFHYSVVTAVLSRVGATSAAASFADKLDAYLALDSACRHKVIFNFFETQFHASIDFTIPPL